jgi:NNP family nitrate/nitrite transporter-like MFS transporter
MGGWVSDKLGGVRVTLWTFTAMVLAVLGVLAFLPHNGQGGSFFGFLIMFLILFTLTGVGNASTFRMIPNIYITEHQRAAAGRSEIQINMDAAKEAVAALGFAGALGAYGGFFIPKSFGSSIAMTGGPDAALYGFIAFYVFCIIMTWWYYSRTNAEMPC